MKPLPISESVKQLSQQISLELDKFSQSHSDHRSASDSLVYVGNWQDAIPRAIWSDATLDAIDVRSWGIIRTQAMHQSAVILSLNDLLKAHLGYSKATISKILYVLRLTRWISLCSQLRTEGGQFRGNIYAIHDAPIEMGDAVYLDAEYFTFVEQQTRHKNKKIRLLARQIWQSMDESVKVSQTPFQRGTDVETSLTDLMGGILQGGIYHKPVGKVKAVSQVQKLNLAENHQVQILNPVKNHQVQKMNPVKKNNSKKQKNEEKQQDNENTAKNTHQVQKLNLVNLGTTIGSSSSSSSSSKNYNFFENKKTTTTTNSEGILKTEEESALVYPGSFNKNEILLSKIYLKGIEPELQQCFLDELAVKIKEKLKTSDPIRNAVGYLSWLCSEHKEGKTYLTSACIQHREQREREQRKNQHIQQQQDEMMRLSQEKNRKKEPEEEPDCIPFDDEEIKRSREKRWQGLKQGKIRFKTE